MKQEIFRLFDAEDKSLALDALDKVTADGKFEMIIRNATISKTLNQLGGWYANWIKYLANEIHHESEDYIHRMLKARFLARIYVMMPIGAEQEQWVELLYVYQQKQMQVALEKHAKRISLSWATIGQMKSLMDAVNNHYISEGTPLPEMEKKRR